MDLTENRDRYSIHQEEAECFKNTRVNDDPNGNDSGSGNDPNQASSQSEGSFQVTFPSGNDLSTAENERQQTYPLCEAKYYEASTKSTKEADTADEYARPAAYFTSSDNCKDEKPQSYLKEKEIKVVQSTQNEYTVQYGNNINGCRPKEKLQTQVEARVRKMSIAGNDKEKESKEKMVFGISFLKSIIGKDPAAIMSELTRSFLLLKDCIKRTSQDEELLEVFLQILARAYMSSSTPRQMIILFEVLKGTGFFDTLEKYLVDLIIKINTGKTEAHKVELVLKNILIIILEQITRNPSSVYVFRKHQALLRQVIDELAKTDSLDDEIFSKYQHLLEQRKSTEKELKQQSYDNKQYKKTLDDFRQYSVSPTADEITSTASPPIRPNKVDGSYEDLHDYLDVQFRLLREDFVAPLREGMTQYIHMMTSNSGNPMSKASLKDLDIKVYDHVRVHSPVVTHQGLCYKLQIKMTPSLKRIEWKFSKRLIYGSMVCLTDIDFNNFFLATVVERDDRDIKRGLFTVRFAREDLTTADVLSKAFRMAETTGYFESYKHVLSSLQSFKDGDLPFEKYIVGSKRETDPPAYLNRGGKYDLRPLIYPDMKLETSKRLWYTFKEKVKDTDDRISSESNTGMDVRAMDFKSWPSKELLHMDKSQYEAVQNALTNEFAIIQGPPGTGKTYIGLQIVKALLHNRSAWAGFGFESKTMLVVCYTNHALDQFLEGIIKFFKGGILRVGGRSNSSELEQFNLKAYRNMDEGKHSLLGSLKYDKRRARREMESLSTSARRLAKTIQIFQTEIVKEDVLLQEMGADLYDNLIHGYRGKGREQDSSSIVKWLEIEQLKKECVKQIQNEIHVKRHKHIEVDDETGRMQKDRMIDSWEDLQFTQDEYQLLLSVRKDIAFYVPELTRLQKINDFQRRYLKLLKATIEDKILDEDIMSQKEADTIDDIWGLNQKEKWRLYRLWIQKLCRKLY